VCSKCFRPLTASTVICKEGVLFCFEHGGVKPPEQPAEPEKTKECCAGCEKVLEERRITALNKKWHKECFVCRMCKGSVAEAYFERQGYPYCANCKDKVPSNKPVQATTTAVETVVPVVQTKATAPAEMCPTCHQPLGSKKVSALDKKWHPECFVCTICKGSVAAGFIERGGFPYCGNCRSKAPPASKPAEHKPEEHTKPAEHKPEEHKPAEHKPEEHKPEPETKPAELCPQCNQPLGPKRVTALDKKWHPECFVCQVCKGSLADGFFEKNGKPICGPCKKNTSSGANSSTSSCTSSFCVCRCLSSMPQRIGS